MYTLIISLLASPPKDHGNVAPLRNVAAAPLKVGRALIGCSVAWRSSRGLQRSPEPMDPWRGCPNL